MGPRQALDHLSTLLLAVLLVGQQVGQVLDLLLIVLHHDLLEVLQKQLVVLREIFVTKNLL